MLAPDAPHHPTPTFRTSKSDLAQASALLRLVLVAPVVVVIWVIVSLLVAA